MYIELINFYVFINFFILIFKRLKGNFLIFNKKYYFKKKFIILTLTFNVFKFF